MTIKTENLAILMTDIVGYTEATMKQSRSENEQLLATHNRILLPILKQYRGRHIKSIGDALLLVFRSPTDAMLCAMAMQDALHEYNRSATDKPIHIRIAASLGEVRVTRDDIFGEPVNLTSRIEGVTPPDEIYLSEAMYMAMNKAEVPAEEVGWKELKGISEPVRIYHLPRFSNLRLVPEAMSTADLGELVYPFGGAHLLQADKNTSVLTQFRHISRRMKRHYAYRAGRPALIALLIIPVLIYGFQYASQSFHINTTAETGQTTETASPVHDENETAAGSIVGQSGPGIANEIQPPVREIATESPAPPIDQKQSTANAETPVAARPAKTVTPIAKSASTKKPAGGKTSAAAVATSPAKPPAPVKLKYTSVHDAKIAYKKKEINQAEYKKVIYALKVKLKQDIRQAKLDLRANKITKAEYKQRVRDAELDYAGRR